MIHEKRGTWWATQPGKDKKAFTSEEEANAWLGQPKIKEAFKKQEPKQEPKEEE